MAKFYYGGQAVMEGVMMRGRKSAAVAVRRPDNGIALYEEALSPTLYQNRLFRLPFLRGMLLLWEMLVLGTRMMTLSANIASGAIDPAAPGGQPHSPQTPFAQDSYNEDQQEGALERPPQVGGAMLVVSLLFSLGFAVAIFFVAPLLLSSLLPGHASWAGLVLEGLIRLGLLVGYLYLIGRIPDIQRVFGYHGAEHKTINAMEHGDPLDVEHVRRASRVHTRCGTGFLLQGLTTREPDDSMIECAIASLQRVLQRDGAGRGERCTAAGPIGVDSTVGMGLAPIRLGERAHAREWSFREPDGGKPHPYCHNRKQEGSIKACHLNT